ncbi:ArsR/SmtB family transcription factor [Actinacidiphila acididurans]|uniref:Helix-turn-helix transcriptional regulator n=1 Tax=Actinacidiphila acididurans TaxID=2784346 RepID=A0ABS2U4N4_9ACTN|nr:DUF5937 family protein [Actinacidiphila acididurans]MBM9510587.1 helix-turn-helix transcriptional regulator [Actinacidiphila acididurans]
MLRIHFTTEDLQRVRVARAPDPLWELMCSVCRVQTRQGPLAFGHWRRSAHQRLRADPKARDALAVLRALIPPAGYIPDFLTPAPAGPELGAGLETVRATPRAQVVRDLARLAATGAAGAAAYAVVAGRGGLGDVTGALTTYHDALLAPHWPQIRAAVAKDVALRARALLEGGTRELLTGLRPFATWAAPVLAVDYPVDRDLHLAGRGLLLVPSYFCWRRPTAFADPDLPPVLVYPVAKDPLALCRTHAEDGVVRLLGRTRAAVLTEAASTEARTTSEIAEAVGVSLPSASYQLGVLRDAGLLASHRSGKYVLHTATPLGLDLLAPRLDSPPSASPA